MNFINIFDHPELAGRLPGAGAGDFRSGADYLMTQEMALALSAASATQRPLLVTGPPGCGKSALARNAAARLKWRYLERAINSRTEITSLLWDVDHMRRLQDAQAGKLDDDLLAYVRASVLWQALDPTSAASPITLAEADVAAARLEPAVVLIDEIDKADPDLPNNLLEVLGGLRFEVADTGCRVTCRSGVPLIVITSNDERDLPPAFVRRCISLTLTQPDLAAVARLHFPDQEPLIGEALALVREVPSVRGTPSVSAGEFLDFVQACKTLQIRAGSGNWRALADACMLKGRSAPRAGRPS